MGRFVSYILRDRGFFEGFGFFAVFGFIVRFLISICIIKLGYFEDKLEKVLLRIFGVSFVGISGGEVFVRFLLFDVVFLFIFVFDFDFYIVEK